MKNLMYLALGIALVATSCKRDDENPPIDPPVNEEELITTVVLRLINQTSNDTATFTFTDLDGDGGNAPVIVGDTLAAGATFAGSIEILNEVDGEDITAEIADEDVDHQFFYDPMNSGLTWSYADMDGNGDPIGLLTSWSSAAVGMDTIRVTLRHEPNKAAAGVSAGDITNAGGETDIEVDLPVVIQ